MARAMWKACLRVGDRTVPVKLYSAVENRALHFRMLHSRDGVPVQQRMVDPRDGREVAPEEVRRGIEIEPGAFVLVRRDELEAVEKSRMIDVLRFVPRKAIDVGWYDRPYFLGPDATTRTSGGRSVRSDAQPTLDNATADYFALAAALAETDRCGVARWTLRGKHYFGALQALGPHLALISLHSAQEVVPTAELERPTGSEVTKAERKLAEQLVATLDEAFDPSVLRDEHRLQVEALIAAKAQGQGWAPVEEAPAPSAPTDLQDALRQSLQAAKERRRAAA